MRDFELELLLKLRVVVARFGEMDRGRWWNTNGQLGPLGAATVRRGLPRTHFFAQARSVFAVAAHRCAEVYDPPSSVTLWRLPEEIEQKFDARWEQWLDHAAEWEAFFGEVADLDVADLAAALSSFGLVSGGSIAAAASLALGPGGRSVALPSPFTGAKTDLELLALGFGRGTKASLVVPYASRADR